MIGKPHSARVSSQIQCGTPGPGNLPHFTPRLLVRHKPFTLPRMGQQVNCIVCEKPEHQCKCEKFCALCHDDHQIRLCTDGQFYCLNCREACDFQITD